MAFVIIRLIYVDFRVCRKKKKKKKRAGAKEARMGYCPFVRPSS